MTKKQNHINTKYFRLQNCTLKQMFFDFVIKKLDTLFFEKNKLLTPFLNTRNKGNNATKNFKFTFIKEPVDYTDKHKNTKERNTSIEYTSSNEYIKKLGNATWTLLHSISSNFPDKPTAVEKKEMLTLIKLLSKYYPCEHCGIEFVKYVNTIKPKVDNRGTFVQWTCDFHNHINQKIGKNIFLCNKLNKSV